MVVLWGKFKSKGHFFGEEVRDGWMIDRHGGVSMGRGQGVEGTIIS